MVRRDTFGGSLPTGKTETPKFKTEVDHVELQARDLRDAAQRRFDLTYFACAPHRVDNERQSPGVSGAQWWLPCRRFCAERTVSVFPMMEALPSFADAFASVT